MGCSGVNFEIADSDRARSTFGSDWCNREMRLSNNPKSVRKRTAPIVAQGQLTGAMAGVESGVDGLQHGLEIGAGDALLHGFFDSLRRTGNGCCCFCRTSRLGFSGC